MCFVFNKNGYFLRQNLHREETTVSVLQKTNIQAENKFSIVKEIHVSRTQNTFLLYYVSIPTRLRKKICIKINMSNKKI